MIKNVLKIMIAGVIVSMSGFIFAPAANAVASGDELMITGYSDGWDSLGPWNSGLSIQLSTKNGAEPPADTRYNISFSPACGKTPTVTNVISTNKGLISWFAQDLNSPWGPSISFTITPYDSDPNNGTNNVYTPISGSRNLYLQYPCGYMNSFQQKLANGSVPIPPGSGVVTGPQLVWSTKSSGPARVGRVVSVTPTTAPGGASYTWKVGKRVVARNTTAIQLKKKWRGKPVKVIIVTPHNGRQVIGFGRVKR